MKFILSSLVFCPGVSGALPALSGPAQPPLTPLQPASLGPWQSGDRVCIWNTFAVGLHIYPTPEVQQYIAYPPEGESLLVESVYGINQNITWLEVSFSDDTYGEVHGFADGSKLRVCGGPPDRWNYFGIGLSSEGDTRQVALAKDMVGTNGWVTLVLKGINDSTQSLQPEWVDAVNEAYSQGLNVIVRLAPPDGESWWANIQGAGLRYVALSLPKPPGKFLYVQLGSEINRGRDFFCTDSSPMTMSDVASRYAYFAESVASITGRHDGDPYVLFAAAPMAEQGLKVFGCCAEPPCAEDQEGASGIEFLQAMLNRGGGSNYLDNMNWHASHAYPKENAPFEESKKDLTLYNSELAALGRQMQVMVTETGWASHRSGWRNCTEDDKASWTAAAYSELFGPDPAVAGVTPWVLADPVSGDGDGFGYVTSDLASEQPVYNTVKTARESAFPSHTHENGAGVLAV